MRGFLFLIACLLPLVHAQAGMPVSHGFKLYSENGKFYIMGIPFGAQISDFGKTEIFSADSTLLYRIDKYTSGYLSNDGRYLASPTVRLLRGQSAGTPLIVIRKDGKPYKEINVAQLVDTAGLSWGLAFGDYPGSAVWHKRIFMHNDTLYVLTVEKKAAIIDVKTGSLVSLEPDSPVLRRFKANVPQPKVQTIAINYPPSFQVPKLSNGLGFGEAIAAEFGSRSKENCKSCRMDVHIEVAIDKNGKGDLHHYFAGDYHQVLNGLKEKMTEWISKQTFDPSMVPEPCEKWVFMDYFFMDKEEKK